jgi:hypothetical protein
MNEFWNAIYPWIVGGIGGSIGAALLLPTKLGEAILKYRFDKLIETYRSEQGRELERLREELSHLGDRGKRANEREYEAIADMWGKFVDCFDQAQAAIVQFVEMPDLNNFSAEEIHSFLSTREFSKEQIDQVQNAQDKSRMYGQIVRWKYIALAHNTIMNTRSSLRKQQIFMPHAIVTDIEQALERASKAVISELIKFRNPDSGLDSKEALAFFNEKDDIFSKVRNGVRKRLMRQESAVE